MSCSVISGACIFLVGLQIIKYVMPWLFKNFIGPSIYGPSVDVRKMGEWALVTGATEGIGKAYAKQLANKGLNIVLVSRSQEKLIKIAKEIENESGVEVKTIAVDFTQGQEIYDKIEKDVEGLEIGVLVNNVGMSSSCPEYFLSTPNRDQFLKDIIACNINSVINMCKIVMPGMVERKKGVVVNISSMSAMIPSPLLTVYGATKAFVDKFSEDLNLEYKQQGITVQCVMPGFVATNMSKIKKATWMAPSADTYVTAALKTVGLAERTTGYFPHALMKLSIDALRFVATDSAASNVIFKQLLNIRSRAIGKTQKSK